MKARGSPTPPRDAGSKQRPSVRENAAQGIRFTVVWKLVVLALAVAVSAFYLLRNQSAPLPSAAEAVEDGTSTKTTARAADRNESRPPTSPPRDPLATAFAKLVKPSPPLSTADLVAQLIDAAQAMPVRRRAALRLGRIGSDEAMRGLKQALVIAPPELKAAIAQGLGECTHPDALPMLPGLLDARDEAVARGAVRGYAARADASSVEVLQSVLRDAARPVSVRTEAALALGDVNLPAAREVLTRAIRESKDETITAHALEGLGKRPFEETQDFFRDYLEASDTSSARRSTALEALGQAPGEVAPFLLNYLKDPDAEVRAAAALALSTTESRVKAGQELSSLLQQETDPNVRARLYQALGNQGGYDVSAIPALAQAELEPEARFAALDLLAVACHDSPSSPAFAFFEQTAVPELKAAALQSADSHQRLSAVIILHRAETPEAARALEEIGRLSNDPRVVKAARPAPVAGARR